MVLFNHDIIFPSCPAALYCFKLQWSYDAALLDIICKAAILQYRSLYIFQTVQWFGCVSLSFMRATAKL